MKIKLLSLLLLSSVFCYSQKGKSKINYGTLDKSGMETSILIEQTSPFSVLTRNMEEAGMFSLQQTYKELSQYDNLNRFSNLEKLNQSIRIKSVNETIKIGGIHTQFETLDANSLNENVTLDSNGNIYKKSTNNIFEKHSKTIFSTLSSNKQGLKTSFYLDADLIVNTTANDISKISIDFDDNNDFRQANINQPIHINYQNPGKKTITFKIHFNNGDVVTNHTYLNVKKSSTDALNQRNTNSVMQNITASINPDLSIYGNSDNFPGLGEYQIFLGADGVLDKPIIVVDGFDPSDSRDITAVYDLLTYTDASNTTQNLGDRIRTEEDFDIVILNFPQYLKLTDNTVMSLLDVTDTNGDLIIDANDYPTGSILVDGGADFIERNALILVELINTLNTQKIGTEQNVIIGPSMGGLISRYALTYMEQNSMMHDTRLWISFDSPHYGANVPIGLQLLFNYFGYGYGDSDSVKLLVDGMLRSPAAMQMLVDHFDAHMNPINSNTSDPVSPSSGLPYTPIGAPNYRDNFQNRMNTMGFPNNLRKISMINGSGTNARFQDINGTDVLPGFDLINSNIDTGDVIVIINTRADTFCEYMPAAGVLEEIVDVKIQAQIFFWITQDTFNATAESFSFTDGVDAAPGGLFDVFALADSLGGDPVLTNFLNAMNAGYFCFIPTTSAMGLSNQQNYYAIPDPNNGSPENDSPFDAWYMPTENQSHVVLTDENVTFAWDEIVLNTLSTDEVIADFIKVKNNPVVNNLTLLSTKRIKDASIALHDITGKTIFSEKMVLDNETQIPLNLSSGVYLLNVSADNKILQTKIIKQ